MKRRGPLLVAVVLSLGALGYLAARTLADPNSLDIAEVTATESEVRVVDRVRELFPQTEGWFRIVATAEFRAGPGGRLVPDLETLTHPRVRWEDGSGHSVFSQFAHSFRDATRIGSGEDPDVWVDVVPMAGNNVAARIENGLVVYESAYEDTHVLYKSTPTHVDEYLLLESPRAPTRWRYLTRKGPGIARLRQAGNSVEAVDADGNPWMRTTRPFAVDREGTRVDGTIRLEGEEIVAEIDLSELTFPVLVDPDWRSTGDMAFGRFYHHTNLLPDGRVLATGGCSASVCSGDLTLPLCNSVVAAAEALDLSTRTFSRVDDASVQRFFHLAESLPDGSVLVAGGCVTPDCSGITDEAEILDVSTESFRAVPHLPEGGAGTISTALADGRILVAGGCTTTACAASAHVFDPAAESFTAVASMNVARGRASTTVLEDGRVLVTGGCTTIECPTVLASAELYDPSADEWTALPDLSVARAGHWASLLPDGRVMVGGGCAEQTCPTVHRSTEILDPAEGTVTGAPDMHRPRLGAVAVLLPDGNVMVNQGCAAGSECDLTNEIYRVEEGRFAMVEPAVTVRAFHSTILHPRAGVAIANGGCQPATCSWWVETWDIADLGPLPDGGLLHRDAGVSVDAGPIPIDAGTGEGGDDDGGCGCRVTSPERMLPWPATVGLWLILRRRIRRRPRGRG